MKKLTYFVVILSIMCALFLGACASHAAPTAGGDIVIGCNFSLTGPGAAWGITGKNNTEDMIKKVNQQGGLVIGGKRYTLKEALYDFKGDPGTSVTNVNSMVSVDKVNVIFANTTFMTASYPLLTDKKIITMEMTGNPELVKNKYAFGILPNYSVSSLYAFKAFMKVWPGLKNIAELNIDDLNGHTAEQGDLAAVNANGLKMVYDDFYPSATTDFYPMLTKAIAAKPDAIIIGAASPGAFPTQVKQARELGFKGGIGISIGSFGSVDTLVKIAGQAAEGVVWCTNASISDPNLATKEETQFVKDYVAAHGGTFIPDAVGYYRTAWIWVQAVQQADSLDADKVAQVLKTGTFTILGWKLHFVSSPASYQGEPHSLAVPMPIQTIQNGQAKVISLVLPEGVVKAQ